MRICYFGIYNPDYSRSRILIDGLRQNGVEVFECNSRYRGVLKYIDLAIKHWCIRKDYDAMIVGFPGYQAMILARFLTRKQIIFDCFTSVYDSIIFDRKQARQGGIKARYYWFLDWLSTRLADIVLFDTQEHIDYASATFGIKKEKFRRIWIGANSDIFCPRVAQNKNKEFSVLFFGTFIPLQGIEYIIGAAKRLENKAVHFTVIGNGQMRKKILRLSSTLSVLHVSFIDLLPQEALVQKIAEADVCLGIFGNTAKTQRVIPNKVYECLAMRKPVITADTLAARELLCGKDVLFVKTADSASLAEGILRLKNDRKAMERIAQNGYDTFIKNATPKILGRELKGIIEEFIK